jgi:hypothetical protein
VPAYFEQDVRLKSGHRTGCSITPVFRGCRPGVLGKPTNKKSRLALKRCSSGLDFPLRCLIRRLTKSRFLDFGRKDRAKDRRLDREAQKR